MYLSGIFAGASTKHKGIFIICQRERQCAIFTIDCSRINAHLQFWKVVESEQDDQTPLHISARLGKADIVQQLLQQGASPNAATTSGYTPLHLSAREGHEDVASVLLDHGASLSIITKGIAPVHLASQDGHVDMVSLLLTRNANVNLGNKVSVPPALLCGLMQCRMDCIPTVLSQFCC
uniref:Uncharacterized protein n=1 Tax=Amazona collaria TaxID=241587 RepID=A0A8B9FXG7_9PSIT